MNIPAGVPNGRPLTWPRISSPLANGVKIRNWISGLSSSFSQGSSTAISSNMASMSSRSVLLCKASCSYGVWPLVAGGAWGCTTISGSLTMFELSRTWSSRFFCFSSSAILLMV